MMVQCERKRMTDVLYSMLRCRKSDAAGHRLPQMLEKGLEHFHHKYITTFWALVPHHVQLVHVL